MWKSYKYYLRNLDCANCAREIEEQLNKRDEYRNVSINFSKLTLRLECNLDGDILNILQKDVERMEPGVLVLETISEEETSSKDLSILFLGALFFLFALLLKESWFSLLFYGLSYVVLGYQTFFKALQLLKQKVIDENFLIVISAIGAFGISKFSEGFMVLFLYQIGKYLEKRATNNVRKSVSELVLMKPTIAHVKQKSSYCDQSPEEVQVGDVLVILKGEKVPVDGILCSDRCSLDTSSLTGESTITEKKKREEILSGCINAGDVFEIQVTHAYENSTVKRILDLMEHASDKKAKTENFVNRAARYYTPIMLMLAFLIFLLTPFCFDITYGESFYRALMVLVVSCPCAIAISVPLCYFAGLGVMSKHGILVKGSSYIDAIDQMKKIVFDKTGTLTTGDFGIVQIEILNPHYTGEEVLHYLVYGESFSTHPLAKSIVKKYADISIPKLKGLSEIQGKGISYEYQKHRVKLGNQKFVSSDLDVDGTVIFVSVDDEVIAYVVLGDEVKETSFSCVRTLKEDGIDTVMFTGDKRDMAEDTSERIGLDHYEAELLPDEKYAKFEELKKQSSQDVIAFVGDGINDAPVLRLSDCGIAMGNGSEGAIEASDVVIMSNDPYKIIEARRLANRTIRILKENLTFALLVKLVVLVCSFFGVGSMGIAVFADVGVTLLTIFNSLRILR